MRCERRTGAPGARSAAASKRLCPDVENSSRSVNLRAFFSPRFIGAADLPEPLVFTLQFLRSSPHLPLSNFALLSPRHRAPLGWNAPPDVRPPWCKSFLPLLRQLSPPARSRPCRRSALADLSVCNQATNGTARRENASGKRRHRHSLLQPPKNTVGAASAHEGDERRLFRPGLSTKPVGSTDGRERPRTCDARGGIAATNRSPPLLSPHFARAASGQSRPPNREASWRRAESAALLPQRAPTQGGPPAARRLNGVCNDDLPPIAFVK